MWGRPLISRCNLPEIANSFDWDLVDIQSADELTTLRECLAVIVVPSALGMHWREALQVLRLSCPGALPIAATGSSENAPWPEMAEAGVFHAFLHPMKEDEVRQSLGFVAAAVRNRGRVASAGKADLRAVA